MALLQHLYRDGEFCFRCFCEALVVSSARLCRKPSSEREPPLGVAKELTGLTSHSLSVRALSRSRFGWMVLRFCPRSAGLPGL